MKGRTRFLRMFKELPSKARNSLCIQIEREVSDATHLMTFSAPYSLNCIAIEVKNNTKMGKMFLKELGYKDD